MKVIVFLLCFSILLCGASFDFRDRPLTEAIREIAVKAGINIIIGTGIKGNVNMTLPDADPIDALELVCQVHGLHISRDGNIYSITKTPPVTKKELEMIQVNYADPAVVAKALERSFHGLSAAALGSRIWTRIPDNVSVELVREFVRDLDVCPESIMTVLTLNKQARSPGRRFNETSQLSLRIMENSSGSISIGKEELISVWPFLVRDWKGYALRVSAGHIRGDSVRLTIDWAQAGKDEKSQGHTEVIVYNGRETSIGSLTAVKEEKGYSIWLSPPDVGGSYNNSWSDSRIQIFLRANWGSKQNPGF